MIAFRFAWAAAAASIVAGCHGGVETDVMERELRLQEDQIYQLLDQVDQYRMMLEACRQENERLTARLHGDAPPADADRPAPEDDLPDFHDFEPPTVEPGVPVDVGPETGPMDLDGLPAEDIPSPPEQSAIPAVEQVTVQPVEMRPGTGAYAARPTITALVQPRDAAGDVVQVSGQVSLMIMDTRAKGSAARLGRWDFSPEQAEARWQNSEDRAGMEFSLPWPGGSEEVRGSFQLWARLVLPEGRKLLAHTELDVAQIAREPAREVASRRSAVRDGFRSRVPAQKRGPGTWTARSGEVSPGPAHSRRRPSVNTGRPARTTHGQSPRAQTSRAAPRWQPYR